MRRLIAVSLMLGAVLYASTSTQIPVPPEALPQDNQPGVVVVPPRAAMDNQPGEIPVPPRPALENQPGIIPRKPSNSDNGQLPSRFPKMDRPGRELEPPTPLAPANGDTGVPIMPLLRVAEYSGSFVWYHFCIWQGVNKVAEKYTPLPFWFVFNGSSIFSHGNYYQWSCRVFTQGTWSDWFTPYWLFAIAWPSPAPTLLSPPDGSHLTTLSPTLAVVPSMLAQRYYFQICETGTGRMIEKETPTPFWVVPEGVGMLSPGATYSWSCRVDNGTGWSNWHQPRWQFTVHNPTDGIQQTPNDDPVGINWEIRPNPFRGQTAIGYGLRQPTIVRISIYNSTGKQVRTYSPGWQLPGEHCVIWDGKDAQGLPLPAGIYLCNLQAAGQESVTRLVKMP